MATAAAGVLDYNCRGFLRSRPCPIVCCCAWNLTAIRPGCARPPTGACSRVRRAGLPPASVVTGAAEIIVLAPAEEVLLTEARVAARSRAQLMQAVPYAIEDQLLTPVEDLHFAATTASGDTVGVAVVAKATLRAWLDALAAVGIRPDALLPESIALPSRADHATVLIESDRAVVRFAPWSAFACAPDELAAWLQRANGDAPPRPLDVYDFRAARRFRCRDRLRVSRNGSAMRSRSSREILASRR